MSTLLYNFFPNDILAAQQLPINGNKTQKQKTVICEGTMNCNFFPNDVLPPFQLPVGEDLTSQDVDQAAPAQEGTKKFKGAAIRTELRDLPPVVISSRRNKALSASRDISNTA